MSAVGAARSVASLLLMLIGVILLLVAILDFFEGFGFIYSLILIVFGIIFLAISGWF